MAVPWLVDQRFSRRAVNPRLFERFKTLGQCILHQRLADTLPRFTANQALQGRIRRTQPVRQAHKRRRCRRVRYVKSQFLRCPLLMLFQNATTQDRLDAHAIAPGRLELRALYVRQYPIQHIPMTVQPIGHRFQFLANSSVSDSLMSNSTKKPSALMRKSSARRVSGSIRRYSLRLDRRR